MIRARGLETHFGLSTESAGTFGSKGVDKDERTHFTRSIERKEEGYMTYIFRYERKGPALDCMFD